MVFTNKYTIKTVQAFLLKKGKVLYTNYQNNLFFDNKILCEKVYFFNLFQDILITDYKRVITLINLNTKETNIINAKSIIMFDATSGNLLLTSNSNQHSCRLSVYNILSNNEKILEEEYHWGIGEIFQDTFYFFENYLLKSLSSFNKNYNWQTQLNRNGKILNFLGVHENVLVVCLQFGNSYGLMGLDINTGEILWNRDDWGLLQGHHTTMQNGKIFSLKGGTFSDSYYLEADVATVSLLRFGEVPNLKKQGFSVFNYTLHENLIYFTANKLDTSDATILGVLTYDSLELLWWQEVELENGAFLAQKPQVDDEKLYILDTEGTLHIFEREEVA